MSAIPLALLVFAAALSTGAAAAQQKPSDSDSIVQVRLIVGSHERNLALCKNVNMPPTIVLIDNDKDTKLRHVHHCAPKGQLLDHDNHKGQEKAFDTTFVRLRTSQRVQWISDTPFKVASIVLHDPKLDKDKPAYPFTAPIPTAEFAISVTSPPVRDEKGDVQARYKVTFDFQELGKIDPDLVCSM
jgi:hypothetical protein